MTEDKDCWAGNIHPFSFPPLLWERKNRSVAGEGAVPRAQRGRAKVSLFPSNQPLARSGYARGHVP